MIFCVLIYTVAIFINSVDQQLQDSLTYAFLLVLPVSLPPSLQGQLGQGSLLCLQQCIFAFCAYELHKPICERALACHRGRPICVHLLCWSISAQCFRSGNHSSDDKVIFDNVTGNVLNVEMCWMWSCMLKSNRCLLLWASQTEIYRMYRMHARLNIHVYTLNF